MHRVVPAATYKRRHRLKLVESERTERLARVIALAEMLWDDEAEAKRFLATPHPELGRKKPIEAALTELGARQVEDVVMRALYGLPVYRAMRFYRIADARHSPESGEGARLHGGRWNSPGRAVIYACETQSGAMLENSCTRTAACRSTRSA